MITPTFRELSRDECDALLTRHHVGRLAYTFHDHVRIVPINYVYWGDRLYLRTAPGDKIQTLAHNPWVAFEVDEIEGPFDWQSVVVRGTATRLEPGGSAYDQRTYAHAITLLRGIIPETFTKHDPVPFRTEVLAIYAHEISGRAASSRGDAASADARRQNPA